MEHNYISVGEQESITALVIFQKDNNLDGRDNLDSLPETPAVYALCGRVNNQPANARFVGESENLRRAIRQHFDPSASVGDECLREFMLSIKTKTLLYELLPVSSHEER